MHGPVFFVMNCLINISIEEEMIKPKLPNGHSDFAYLASFYNFKLTGNKIQQVLGVINPNAFAFQALLPQSA
jgi:hypothetical protein